MGKDLSTKKKKEEGVLSKFEGKTKPGTIERGRKYTPTTGGKKKKKSDPQGGKKKNLLGGEEEEDRLALNY